MAKAKTVKAVAFSPYSAIEQHGGMASTSGINWSHAEFTSAAQCDAFEKECNVNGYRTRSRHKHINSVGPNTHTVQYHHYQD